MKASVLSLLGVAAAVSAGYGDKPSTTSTVYTTSVYTITECPSYVTDCPEKGKVTTDYISLYTTVCPVEETKTKSYPASTPTGPPPPPPTYPASSSSKPAGPPAPPTYPASPPSKPTGPPSPPSPPQSPPTYPASPPPPPPSKPSGPVVPPPVVTTVTISTCVPTVITSIYTVTETPKQYPTYPVGTGSGGSPPKKPTGTGSGSPTGGSYPYTSSKPTTVPYTGAASANKVGGLLMAVGLAAALL